MNNRLILDKPFNSIIFLAERISYLYLTKAIKLLYIMDEKSIKETGVPVTWLNYKAWKLGPVPEEVYFELKRISQNTYTEPKHENEYIEAIAQNEGTLLKPKKEFDDSSFSDEDIEIMENVIKHYGKYSSEELIDILHKEGTLWHNVVIENNLEEQFKLKSNRSDFTIELTDLIKDDDFKKSAYSVAYASLMFSSDI